MLDEAYRQRNSYAVELALANPKWGLHRIARETNLVFGGKYSPMNWRHVDDALAGAGVKKVGGKWQRATKGR